MVRSRMGTTLGECAGEKRGREGAVAGKKLEF